MQGNVQWLEIDNLNCWCHNMKSLYIFIVVKHILNCQKVFHLLLYHENIISNYGIMNFDKWSKCENEICNENVFSLLMLFGYSKEKI